MFVSFKSKEESRTEERLQMRSVLERLRVCPQPETVCVNDIPNVRELVSEYLPVPTK